MSERMFFEAKCFLVNYLKDKNIEYEQIHPWRKSWEFVVLHSLRVEAYVVKLLELEHHGLTHDEMVLVRIAAILHDIGRIQQRENHAEIGREIVREWIQSSEIFHASNIDCNRLLTLIGKHSNKQEKDEDYCSKILKDADILDEIGAISIFMASNWIDRGNPYYFAALKERVESKEISFCNEMYDLISTEGAKKMLLHKREFINTFCKQLQEEIEGTVEFGKVILEDYFI